MARVSTEVFRRLLNRCIDNGDIAAGREVHHLIVKCGLELDAYLGSYLIRMYDWCGSLPEASQIFKKLNEPTVFSWSAMISAYAKHGHNQNAIGLYNQMRRSRVEPDGHVYVAVLKVCASIESLRQGKLIHVHILGSRFKSDLFVCNTLIDMYAKCGCLKDGHKVFAKLQKRDLVTWNTMIAGYVQNEHAQEAFQLFQEMLSGGIKPNEITFVCILRACTIMASLGQGKIFHSLAIEDNLEIDLLIGNALIGMYTKCGSLRDAQTLFDRLPKKDVVTWTAMITGCTEHGHRQEALHLFERMQGECIKPNDITFISILKACSSIADLDAGKLIHAQYLKSDFESDIIVSTSLIVMYMNCGSVKDAEQMFDKSSRQDAATWNAIIMGYTQHDNGQKAVQLFKQMQQECVEPDRLTFLSTLKACSGTDLNQGKMIHACVIGSPFESDTPLGNTLIHMYAECKSLEEGHRVFDKLPKRDVVTWNAIVAGYSQHGQCQAAIELFQQMQQDGPEPNQVTFVCMLTACSSLAALEKGKQIHANILLCGFQLDAFTGSALIHMYSKCGSLEDAHGTFLRLPNQSVVTWSAMIAGFSECSDYKSALRCFDDMQREYVKPDDVVYVSLLSACSHLGLLDEGYLHFKLMIEHGITPKIEHYNCMLDLLGRAGHFDEVRVLLQSMPFQPNMVSWTSLLGHCRTHGNVELGEHCFDNICKIDCRNSAGYFLMSSIYANAGMQINAEKVEARRVCENALKTPGKAVIEIGMKVHEFIVGDKSHLQSGSIYAKLQNLSLQMKGEGHMLWWNTKSLAMSSENKEDTLCHQ